MKTSKLPRIAWKRKKILINPNWKYEEHTRRKAIKRRSYRAFMLYLYCNHCHNDDVRVLEWCHIDRKTKFAGVPHMINKYGWVKIVKEMNKCVVLCANCHKIFDHGQFGRRNWEE